MAPAIIGAGAGSVAALAVICVIASLVERIERSACTREPRAAPHVLTRRPESHAFNQRTVADVFEKIRILPK